MKRIRAFGYYQEYIVRMLNGASVGNSVLKRDPVVKGKLHSHLDRDAILNVMIMFSGNNSIMALDITIANDEVASKRVEIETNIDGHVDKGFILDEIEKFIRESRLKKVAGKLKKIARKINASASLEWDSIDYGDATRLHVDIHVNNEPDIFMLISKIERIVSDKIAEISKITPIQLYRGWSIDSKIKTIYKMYSVSAKDDVNNSKVLKIWMKK